MTAVCIDVSAAVHQRAGLGRYAHELVKGLMDLGRGEVSSPVGAATAPLPRSTNPFTNSCA